MNEKFLLPGGEEIGTGLLDMDEPEINVSSTYNVYGEEFYLDVKDIEKLLKGDVYKTYRRMRSPMVLNQGPIGQCNASATTNAFHNMRQLDGLAHIPLCSNYIYMNINRGVDGGSQLIHGLEFAAKGVAPRVLNVDSKEVMFPHNVFNKRSVDVRLLQAADAAAPTFQSWEAFRLPSDNFTTFRVALASALARGHQVVHAWHVGNNSMDLRNGYVVQGNGPGNHATLFHSAKWVGGADIVHPDCENSWGPSKHIHYGTVSRSGWGEDGFALFTMADAYKCAKNHVFWVFSGNKIKGV
jgi:hypothetical protein